LKVSLRPIPNVGEEEVGGIKRVVCLSVLIGSLRHLANLEVIPASSPDGHAGFSRVPRDRA
jgi:hypothetical protein